MRDKKAKIGIIVFGLVFAVISILGLMLPLRPQVSELEKRELTKFPEFTWESFWDGSWCSQVSLWYADTFPYRDILLSANAQLKELYGIRTTQLHGQLGTGDEIPDVSVPSLEDSEATKSTEESSAEETESTEETESVESIDESYSQEETEESSTFAAESTEDNETPSSESPAVLGEKVGAIYLTGKTAYEIYYFSREAADIYIEAINQAAEELDGIANVYAMVVPTSFGIYIDENTRTSLDGSSEQKAELYLLGSLDSRVNSIYLYDVLKSHKEEYIYFRTDHHWTADGAYYAYEQFAKKKGWTPTKREDLEKMEFTGFAGSFYAGTEQTKILMDNPDTITAYVPKGTNLMEMTQSDGSSLKWYIINDVTHYNHGNKYSCFIGGDNPFTVIENPKISDGSSCVVIKDSFGNAYAPYLVDHYQTVYVLDYRAYKGNFIDFVKDNEVQDVIFLHNLSSSIGSKSQMEVFLSKIVN
ncbi:MAG: DHHW family protein [Lachnospiraceae bacterium]